MNKKILFISNGHGEDLVAAEIVKNLKSAEVLVLPLVGEGKAFEGLGIEILGSRKNLPSGGFSLRHLSHLIGDLSAGLLGQTIKNLSILRKLKGKIDLVIGIGDIVPIIGALITKAPFIFVGVNKSNYFS